MVVPSFKASSDELLRRRCWYHLDIFVCEVIDYSVATRCNKLLRLVTCGLGNKDVSGSCPNLSGLPSSFPLPLEWGSGKALLVIASLDFCLTWLSSQLVSKPMAIVVSGEFSSKQLGSSTPCILGWHHCSVLSQMFVSKWIRNASPMSCSRWCMKSAISTYAANSCVDECSWHALIVLSIMASVDICSISVGISKLYWVPPTFLTSNRASPAFPRRRLGLDLRRPLSVRNWFCLSCISHVHGVYRK